MEPPDSPDINGQTATPKMEPDTPPHSQPGQPGQHPHHHPAGATNPSMFTELQKPSNHQQAPTASLSHMVSNLNVPGGTTTGVNVNNNNNEVGGLLADYDDYHSLWPNLNQFLYTNMKS